MNDTPGQPVEAGPLCDSKQNDPEPHRVIIRALVTDIEGIPEARVKVLGQVFASQVLGRALNHRPQDTPHDELHFLPGCDSRKPIKGYFIYDFNYTKELTRDELQQVQHDVYYAHLLNGEWIFVKRPVAGYKKYCLMFPWGGAKMKT